ncbi:hypothetical protein G7029_29735 [Pseudomonas carnis]|uniref:hypothetical protein n=1 Tax=Pseudomonas carnis TaxID=2487355 RepID=UPI0015E2FC55|nr:hypothetical protein [Pseudomonas carnis]MBA1271650.1 hypothetical protein [Pseudomonas carnis]
MAALYLVGVQLEERTSVLAEDFTTKLSAFNQLTRDIRAAGVVIKHLVVLDNKIFIDQDSVDLFLQRFGGELHRISFTPAGRCTRNTMRVRGVDVAWYTSVKEQDQ